VFLNNRYLDPTLGRFISVDPLVNMTHDAYGYGNNNPTTYSDPSGLIPCFGVCDFLKGVGGAFVDTGKGLVTTVTHPSRILQNIRAQQAASVAVTRPRYSTLWRPEGCRLLAWPRGQQRRRNVE
jgi:uncharacterized protein RhaS with RHS repeats